MIEGEAGIGKSRLLADLIDQAEIAGVTCLVGAGDAIEKSTPSWSPTQTRKMPRAALETKASTKTRSLNVRSR